VPNGEIHVQLAVNYGEDPKLRALAEFGRDARACRDLYVQMVCYCKRNLTDGFVPAVELGVLVYPDSPKTGRRDAERLVKVGLAEHQDDGYFIPGFLKRNKSKAQVEALSEARAESGRHGGVRSGQVRRGEANPKQLASPEAKQSASEIEANGKQVASVCLNTETETETETVDAAQQRRRASRIPDPFTVTAEMVAWANGNAPHVDGRRETTKFINYWTAKSGKDATKLDWPATWRNWMMTAEERASHTNGTSVNGQSALPQVSPREEHRYRR
jgi:hypothetical protein